tara:strand:- start:46 stop:189 length:144 start_codon:yes stop_codon:yes gene_type:complete
MVLTCFNAGARVVPCFSGEERDSTEIGVLAQAAQIRKQKTQAMSVLI